MRQPCSRALSFARLPASEKLHQPPQLPLANKCIHFVRLSPLLPLLLLLLCRVEACWPLLRILGLGGYAHAVDVARSSLACPPVWVEEHATHPAQPGRAAPGKAAALAQAGVPDVAVAAVHREAGHGAGGVTPEAGAQQQLLWQGRPHEADERGPQGKAVVETSQRWLNQLAVGCGDKTVRVVCGEWEVRKGGAGGGGRRRHSASSGAAEEAHVCTHELGGTAGAEPEGGETAAGEPPGAAPDSAAAEGAPAAAAVRHVNRQGAAALACSAGTVTGAVNLWRNLADQVLCVAHHPCDARESDA